MKKVGIVMGSDSDRPIVDKAVQTLREYGVPCEVHVYSAHRTPVEAGTFARTAADNGIGVAIAMALLLDPQLCCGALAGVFTGAGRGFAPCTAQSVMELLRHYGINPARKRAVVVGRSLVIGRPVAMLLLAANATVTVCHSRTNRLEEFTRGADIVVAALGKARALDEDYFEPGQIVIDVGINDAGDGTLVGDVDFDSVEPLVDAITPVPAGVGSVTTSVLCAHVIEAAERR